MGAFSYEASNLEGTDPAHPRELPPHLQRGSTVTEFVIQGRSVGLGEDRRGTALEVIAVETDHGNLLVIHAMEQRPRYREAYREVRRCKR
jgi:hypothetical protein